MELRDYLGVISRRARLILAVVVLATVAAVVVTVLMPATYSATASMHVATPASLASASVLGTTDYMDRIQNTYAQIATSGDVRQAIRKQLKLSSLPSVSVKLHPNTELMEIVGSGRSAALAAAIANRDAKILIANVKQIGDQTLAQTDAQFRQQMARLQAQLATERAHYNTLAATPGRTPAQQARLADLKTDISVTVQAAAQQEASYETNRASILDRSNLLSVFAPATPPVAASGPKRSLAVALGLFVGLIAGVGLAFLFENLSTRMEATEEIEHAGGLPILGAIPRGNDAKGSLFNSGSPTEEAFRRLRTNILALERGESHNVLLVTSAEPNEGKSTIVANLAASLAQAGRRVVAVDADLRLPTLHEIFGVKNSVGLGQVIRGTTKLESVLATSKKVPGVTILPSGGPLAHPAELLASNRTREILEELASKFDVVLVDSPALLAIADALSLATVAPDVMIVVGRSQTRREALVNVRKQLSGVGANPLGIVVNRAEATPAYHYYNQNVR